MNKKEFSIYLHKPHLIDKHAEIALQEVVTDFPYFHAAQQLLLKAHQNNGSYHFDRQLPITSLLHGNRALLYAYLKDSLVREFEFVAQNDLTTTEETLNEITGSTLDAPAIYEDEKTVTETAISYHDETSAPEITDTIVETEFVLDNITEGKETIESSFVEITDTIAETEFVPDNITEEKETIESSFPEIIEASTETGIISDNLKEEKKTIETSIPDIIDNVAETEVVADKGLEGNVKENRTGSIESSAPAITDLDLPFQDFEKKYLGKKENEIIDNLITPESWTVIPINEKEEPIVENTFTPELRTEITFEKKEEPDVKEIPDAPETSMEMPLEEKQESKEEPLTREEEKVISTIEPHDFLTWLQAKKTKFTPSPKPVEKEVVIQHIQKEEPVKQVEFTKEEQEITEGGEKKIRKFNDLIDKFIETSPSISKPKPTKFYNPAEKARESVTENFDLVTETLAKIYTKQNNYKKAILVYEKLSLLHPEKISYFAAQISELQTLLNK
jgi:hypothetical protein